jgi:hypothetical protein
MPNTDNKAMNARYTDFRVLVGNVGTVHTGRDYVTAARVYAEYLTISKSGHGRAAGEDVTLIGGDDIVLEYHGTNDTEDDRS